MDGTLPFRLRSPSKLLQWWADALVRIFWCKVVNKAIHYLHPLLGVARIRGVSKVLEDSTRNTCRVGGTGATQGHTPFLSITSS